MREKRKKLMQRKNFHFYSTAYNAWDIMICYQFVKYILNSVSISANSHTFLMPNKMRANK